MTLTEATGLSAAWSRLFAISLAILAPTCAPASAEAASFPTAIRLPGALYSGGDAEQSPNSPQSALSFFVASDVHLGWDPVNQPVCNSSYTSYELNKITVDEMNHVPGVVDWPPEMGGGRIRTPKGVVISGDIVDRGPEAIGYQQWVNFTRLYGLSGEGLLRYPVYESFGNHDGGNLTSGKHYPNYVRLGIRARNKVRPGVTHLSDNELHYSWDWPITVTCSLHLVMLGIYAGRYGEKVKNPFYGPTPESWIRPEYSLNFLEHDLAVKVGDSGRPVVIFQHYGFDGFSNTWWTGHEREELARILAPYNVLTVFVGHTHVANYYQWAGYDVVNTPCTQGDAAWHGPPDPQFIAVDISTRDGGKTGTLRVAQRKGADWGPVRFQKESDLCGSTLKELRDRVTDGASPLRGRYYGVNAIENLMREFPPPPPEQV